MRVNEKICTAHMSDGSLGGGWWPYSVADFALGLRGRDGGAAERPAPPPPSQAAGGAAARPAPPPPSQAAGGRPLEGMLIHFPLRIEVPDSKQIGYPGRVRALGGRIMPTMQCAFTHCVVPFGLTENDAARDPDLLRLLRHCSAHGICVVEPSWVDAVAAVPGDADWASVSVDTHVPPIMALLDDLPSQQSPPPAVVEQRGGDEVAAATAAVRARAQEPLSTSLGETWAFLRRAHPEQTEADLLARAIEQSMLDFALQLRHVGRGAPPPTEDPYSVLGISGEGATVSVIRSAYRKRALETHPDRGGTPGAFLQVSVCSSPAERPLSPFQPRWHTTPHDLRASECDRFAVSIEFTGAARIPAAE
jgi:hypothetical protein